MKAVVLHGHGSFSFESSWPEPEVPDGWALVKVSASGICGSDLPRMTRTGSYFHPSIPGHEFAGVVAKPGSAAFRAGDRVAVLPIIPCGRCRGCATGPFHCENYDFIGSRRNGGFAEFCAVPERNLFRLPGNLTDEEGAFIEPISVALHTLRRSGMRPGARVLVFGGGAIGILVAQWAGVLGASEVVLADIRAESLAVARACGIGKTLDPRSDEFKSIGKFDNVFEAAGSAAALLSGIEVSSAGATVTVVGRDTGDTVVPLRSFEQLMRKELDLKGCWGYDISGEEPFVYDCLGARKFTLSPMVTHRIALEQGPETVVRMRDRAMFYCKVLFKVA